MAKKGNFVTVTKCCLISFSIGQKYRDQVLCHVVDMDDCHLLLGKPWELKRRAMYDSQINTYSFLFEGRKIILLPKKNNLVRSTGKDDTNKTHITDDENKMVNDQQKSVKDIMNVDSHIHTPFIAHMGTKVKQGSDEITIIDFEKNKLLNFESTLNKFVEEIKPIEDSKDFGKNKFLNFESTLSNFVKDITLIEASKGQREDLAFYDFIGIDPLLLGSYDKFVIISLLKINVMTFKLMHFPWMANKKNSNIRYSKYLFRWHGGLQYLVDTHYSNSRPNFVQPGENDGARYLGEKERWWTVD